MHCDGCLPSPPQAPSHLSRARLLMPAALRLRPGPPAAMRTGVSNRMVTCDWPPALRVMAATAGRYGARCACRKVSIADWAAGEAADGWEAASFKMRLKDIGREIRLPGDCGF